MQLIIGNWVNDNVTNICHVPTRRQLLNALQRMRVVITPSTRMIFRNVPVGDHNPTDEQVYEWDEIVRGQ